MLTHYLNVHLYTVPACSVCNKHIYQQNCPARRNYWLLCYETLPQRSEIPHLHRYMGVSCSNLPAAVGMHFIHSIFNTNPCDIIPFCFFSCWYLFHSVSRHLTHMFRVIKCFQSLEIWCGGRGCIGFEKLGSFAVLNQVGGVWVFHSYSLTHTLDRHTLTPTPPTPPNPNTHTQSQNPSRSFQPN